MLKGKDVHLVAVEAADLPLMQKWRNNPDYRKFFREYRELSMAHQEKWYREKCLNDPSTLMFAIRRNQDSELVGICGLCYTNWVHRHADLSLYIGWQDSYIDDAGYAE